MTEEVRCGKCRALLARVEDQEVVVKRSGIEVHVEVPCRMTVACYRCGSVTYLDEKDPLRRVTLPRL